MGALKPFQNHFSILKRIAPEPRPSKRKQSVSFAKVDQIFPTITLDEYTDNEINATWYTAEEEDAIRGKCFKILNTIGSSTTKKYCTRGLERMTPKAQHDKDELRASALVAILEEQLLQRSKGITNPKKIASIYIAARQNNVTSRTSP